MSGWGEAVKIEQGGAVQNGVADLDHPAESDEILVVDFVVAKQVSVVAEVAQEPSELPKRFGRAIDAAGKGFAFELLRLKDSETEEVKGLLRVPAILGSLHADEEQSIGDVAGC